MKPLVSVIMPVYNCEKYVAEAVQSVLNQTYSPIEVICIDDASTDKSLTILKSFEPKIRIITNAKNAGISISRNNGIPLARGEFIAFADADDVWLSHKLEKQMGQFEANPLLDISFTMIENFLSPELPDEFKVKRSFPTGPIAGPTPGTAVIKKTSFDKVGPFDPDYHLGEFIDWVDRARNLGLTSAMIEEVLDMRRIHETNTTSGESTHAQYLKAIRNVLARKRNASSDL